MLVLQRLTLRQDGYEDTRLYNMKLANMTILIMSHFHATKLFKVWNFLLIRRMTLNCMTL
jgi:hypothetical protein